MDPSPLALPGAAMLASWIAALPLLAWALVRARWRDAAAGPVAHVWPAALAALVVLWSLRGSVAPGFAFHLDGMAALALVSGPWLALAGGAVVVAVSAAIGGAWANGAATWLVAVAVPVAVVMAVLRAAERLLPANFFVYVFVVAFFGAALAYVVAGAVGLALMVAVSEVPASLAFGEYQIYLVTLGFGEAILTGMALTLAAVYRPAWVATFDAARYLR